MSTQEATLTTKDKIKAMFLSGQILTSCGAAKDFVTADLRKYITTLKREGLDIVDRWVSSTTSKRYKEYALRQFMPKKEITTQPEEITPALEVPAIIPTPYPVNPALDLPEPVVIPESVAVSMEPVPCIHPPLNPIQKTLFD